MKNLKVCFVGVGSIAKRHIKNLKMICDKRDISLHIDAFRRTLDMVEGIDSIYLDIKDVPSDYDCAFITVPTFKHLDSLRLFQNKAKHFFIEKPVVSVNQISEAKGFDTNLNSTYYVACPLRYNSVIQYIKRNIDPKDVLAVRSISSSYLPDWRADTDYRNTYSARKEQGGGVDIDLIHEWDYITYLFGWPKEIKCFIGKKSDLEIDSNDYAVYIAECEDKVIELHLDYFGRKAIREIELITKKETIVGDLVNGIIHFERENKVIDFKEQRDDFQQKELEYFLEVIEGKRENNSDFTHALKVLKLTQGNIEE